MSCNAQKSCLANFVAYLHHVIMKSRKVSLNYWLLKLVKRMESCICLHLFQLCWLVCMIPATSCNLLTSSFLKTMGDSCYVTLCTSCSRCVNKLLNDIELEDLFPWLCGQFVVTVAKYFLNVLSITLIKLNHTLSIALLT